MLEIIAKNRMRKNAEPKATILRALQTTEQNTPKPETCAERVQELSDLQTDGLRYLIYFLSFFI